MTALVFVLLGVLAASRGEKPLPERLPREPGPRTEFFLLELADSKPVGAALLRRRELPDGFQLEGEWQFDIPEDHGGSERVQHVERCTKSGSQLSWREWGPTRARSLTVDRAAEGSGLAFLDSARGSTRRGTLESTSRAVLPLELLEQLRAGAIPPAAVERFDPLSRSVERVEIRSIPAAEEGAVAYAIVRADGTSAGSCEFLGGELYAFRWQQGDLVARRVSEAEFRARSPLASVTIRRP